MLANSKYRYSENGRQPVTLSGYVHNVDLFFFEMTAQPEEFTFSMLKCYYQDIGEALHLNKGQSVTVTGRISGISGFGFTQINAFMCDIAGVNLESNPDMRPQDVRENIVRVHCYAGGSVSQGTGIIVDRDGGLVLTAHHVVGGAGLGGLFLLGGLNAYDGIEIDIRDIRMSASLVKHCASVDQAYLRVTGGGFSHLELADIFAATAPTQADQEVYYWAWGAEELRWQSGLVEGDFLFGELPILSEFPVTINSFAISGDSGSPVFNEYGHLLGVLTRSNLSDKASYYHLDLNC